MVGAAHWTQRQERWLRTMYPRYPKYQIEEVLAPHSWSAIRMRAARLGIARKSTHHRDWMQIARDHKPTFAFRKGEW